ncbi:MAG: DUF2304 domain-containing protein [Clostridia bacterium]|nr:DUF2304 domain-containing protein [Clostridia bacterium]
MSITLRIILLIGSIVSFFLCVKKIKQAKLKVENSIIWMIGSLILVLMSIFSDGVAWLATKLGFMASVNFVFFIIIFFLLIQVFIDNLRISELNEKIKNLNHYIALKENKEEKED